jgi:hypothetical protein
MQSSYGGQTYSSLVLSITYEKYCSQWLYYTDGLKTIKKCILKEPFYYRSSANILLTPHKTLDNYSRIYISLFLLYNKSAVHSALKSSVTYPEIRRCGRFPLEISNLLYRCTSPALISTSPNCMICYTAGFKTHHNMLHILTSLQLCN